MLEFISHNFSIISNFYYFSLQREKVSERNKNYHQSSCSKWLRTAFLALQTSAITLQWLKPTEELHPHFSITWIRQIYKTNAWFLNTSVSKWHLQYNKSITDGHAWSRDEGCCAISCLPQFLKTHANLISYFLVLRSKMHDEIFIYIEIVTILSLYNSLFMFVFFF